MQSGSTGANFIHVRFVCYRKFDRRGAEMKTQRSAEKPVGVSTMKVSYLILSDLSLKTSEQAGRMCGAPLGLRNFFWAVPRVPAHEKQRFHPNPDLTTLVQSVSGHIGLITKSHRYQRQHFVLPLLSYRPRLHGSCSLLLSVTSHSSSPR